MQLPLQREFTFFSQKISTHLLIILHWFYHGLSMLKTACNQGTLKISNVFSIYHYSSLYFQKVQKKVQRSPGTLAGASLLGWGKV